MRITAVTITNFLRIRKVHLQPDADRNLFLIAGKNAQGKTSILRALEAAFGGARAIPPDPVRHGADEAGIHVVLDDGDLVIQRRVEPSGHSKLEVRDRKGAVRSPQALLDKLIGLRFLDPLAFLALPPKEQRQTLLNLIDREGKIADLDSKRERIYDRRTDVGRDVTRAKGELARLPDPAPEPTPLDVAELAAARAQLGEQLREVDSERKAAQAAAQKHASEVAMLETLKRSAAVMEQQIEALQAQLANTRSAMSAKADAILEAEQLAAEAADRAKDAEQRERAFIRPRLDQLDADLARADAHNKAVFEVQSANARRRAAEETVVKAEAGYAELTKTLDKIDSKKIEFLRAANLPVENLSFDAGGLLLNGAPFASASGAERHRVALALAMSASPKLDDVWIRDGALLDEDSLEMVARFAIEAGKRVWIERVGTSDDGAVIIQDGEVSEP